MEHWAPDLITELFVGGAALKKKQVAGGSMASGC